MKTLIQAAAVTLFAASAAQAQQAVQWTASVGGNGHWYQFVRVPGTITWQSARSAAAERNGDLGVVDSAQLTGFLDAFYPPATNACFIGCQRIGDTWRWLNNHPVSWTNWCPCGQPSGDGPFVEMWGGGYWNDVSASEQRQGYLIEWSADCNADGIVDYGQILDGSLSDVNADGIPDACQAPCVPSDLNDDGAVDGSDLGALLSEWGPTTGQGTRADINGDGIVNGADLGTLLANWGSCGGTPMWATVIQWQPDPAVVTDAQLRAGIQATGLPWRVRDTVTQIEMVLIPPGTFQMGCAVPPDSEPCQTDEFPVHEVTLTSAFYLSRYEVTQAQWVARMGSNPSYFRGSPDSSSRPVEQVSWNAIQPFMAATSMRLPTEAEWEYACRAGTQSPLHNGSSDTGTLGDIAWFNLNSGLETHPVGLKAANGFGLHDMLGNVGEWVHDHFAPYPAAPQVDPVQLSGSYVVMRGGGWGQLRVRSSHRSYDAPNVIYLGEGGFRVARNP